MTRGAVRRPAAAGCARPAGRGPALFGWAAVLLVVAAVTMAVDVGRTRAVTSTPAASNGGESALGPDLYLANCASCHGDRGEGTFRGPTLIGVGAASAHYWLASGRMPLPSPDAKPVRQEPAFTGEEIALLVDYVASLGDGPSIPEVAPGKADLDRGGTLYRVNCAACHNWDGKGGALVYGDNAPLLHVVPTQQVAEAVRIGPGTMPAFAEEQLSDEELRDLLGYVEYLRDPRDAGGFGLAHWGPSTEAVAGLAGLGVIVLITAWIGERRRG